MEFKTPYPLSRQGDITTKAVVLSRKDTSGPKWELIFALALGRVSFLLQRCLSDIILELSAKMG